MNLTSLLNLTWLQDPSDARSPSVDSSGSLQNQYYVCPEHFDEPFSWDPYSQRDEFNAHTDYYGGVFQVLERHLEAKGLTFYLTWKLDELPSYGKDVVAVVMGDEWGGYPRYTQRVRAVFKMLGTDFPLEMSPFQTPAALSAVTAVKYARTQLLRFPFVVRKWWDWCRNVVQARKTATPIYDVPIGYVNQEDLPVKPFSERAYDLYFSGSVSNKDFSRNEPQYWLRTPKDVARSSLVTAMRRLRSARSDLSVEIDTRPSYVPREQEKEIPERSYSEMMMDTRICPVPRGTRLETGRLYEALRFGCVVVTEPLPDRWFTRDLPAITLHDWRKLPEIVEELTEQPERLEKLHRASLRWWKNKCSEEAVGRYMADKLNTLLLEESLSSS